MVQLTAAALLASLVAAVAAGGAHGHGHLHRKHAPAKVPPKDEEPQPAANDTACGCTTYTTYWYGEPTYVPLPKPSTSTNSTSAVSTTSTISTPCPSTSTSVKAKPTAPAYVPPPPKKEDQPKPPPKQEAPKPEAPKPKQEAPKPKQEAPKESSGHPSITPNGNKWSMAYTPYRPDGQCKTASEVFDDIGKIKASGFTTVRMYAPDCNGPKNIGDACKAHGMKMIVGIFIDGKGLGAAREQVTDLVAWGQDGNCWSIVEMVVAGNEAIFGGFVTASEMASFITEVKSAFQGAGYNGPVTTAETLNIVQANADVLCAVVDVIGANLHPFFNGNYAAEDAGILVERQLNDLAAACGGKLKAYNLETGWPSNGQTNGVAQPGVDEQRKAIESIVAKVGSVSSIFSFEDDTWKHPGALGIEQFWGCFSLFSS